MRLPAPRTVGIAVTAAVGWVSFLSVTFLRSQAPPEKALLSCLNIPPIHPSIYPSIHLVIHHPFIHIPI